MRALTVWDVGIICWLLLIWSTILTAHPRQIRQRAATDDLNRLLIGILLVSAACASLVAIIYILSSRQNLLPSVLGLHITLSVVSIVCSWLLLHTVFTLHYAHCYYRPESKTPSATHAGGLDFPGDEPPDYLDFAYFALVLGMTYQVSDVAITSRLIRRVALLHGLLSFWFYTVVFALSINILSSLVGSNH
jgi:uncharacterized membrane protein